ncbi:MAG: hypothetical protein ACLR9X_07750 [Clostridia bacterium]
MDRKRKKQQKLKVNSIIDEDIDMQQIYKKYIGEFPKLKKLKDYFFDFHDFMIKCCDDDCDVNIQNDLIKKLKIEYNLNKRIFLNALDFKEQLLEIKNDFNIYFNQMNNNIYMTFEDIEDDKLVLYNILEEYFEVLKTYVTNKTERRFLKVVTLDINRKIDVSKNFKLFDNSFSNISWIVVLFVFIIVLWLSLMSFFNSLLEQFIIFIFNCFLDKNTVINLNKIIENGILFAAFLISVVIMRLIFKKFGNKITNILPEISLHFPRSNYERQLYYTFLSILVSTVALFISYVALTLK